MTGCGCGLLVALIVGLIAFMIFGSTDPGAPVESAVALLLILLIFGMSFVPLRRALVRPRRAQ